MNASYEIFVGRLGKNPELKYTLKQEPVCYLSVAVNKNSDESCDWKRVIVWGKQAELCSVQLKKGEEIFVQGQNIKREFKDRNGNQRSIDEIKAKLVGFTNL